MYGAAGGHRGGLFVGGAELQRRFVLPWDWDLRAGVFAGGGGGAAAPVGGGLMLRAAATLTHDIGPLRGGLSWSHVRFPSGEISSSQLGLVLSWERPFRYFDSSSAGQPQPASGTTGLGFQRLAGTVGAYQLRGSDTRRIGLVGGRAEWQPTPSGVYTGIEAAAAASGGAAGYMEILGNVGWRWTPMPDVAASRSRCVARSVSAAAAPCRPTAARSARSPSAPASTGAMAGAAASRWARSAVSARRCARTPPRCGWRWISSRRPMQPAAARSAATNGRRRCSTTCTRNATTAATASLDTVGIKLNRFVDDHVYLSAQAHSAYAGGAGAYSIGLIGAGLATAPGSMFRFGAELLLGAAGGGGVATGSGAIAQSVAWAGWSVTPESQVRLGVGAVKAIRGDLRSGVLEISWTRALGLGGR